MRGVRSLCFWAGSNEYYKVAEPCRAEFDLLILYPICLDLLNVDYQ